MTIYELTQAVVKRWRFVVIAGLSVVVFALVLAFRLDDGISWRSGEKWEAQIQIAVVSAGNSSLVNAETRSEHEEAALLYAGLLESNEATDWISKVNGFTLDDPVVAEVERGSSLMTATLIAPSERTARAASLSIYDYLVQKLAEPLPRSGAGAIQTSVPTLELVGPFEARLKLNVADGLSTVSEELFLRADTEVGSPVVVPVARSAGQSISVETTLAPIMSVVVSLQDSRGSELDAVRLAPDPADGHVSYYPDLVLSLGERSIVDREEASWQIDRSEITVHWEPGEEVLVTGTPGLVAVDPVLLTSDPAPVPIGGRRGPILLGAVLILGMVMILTVVIVVETWDKERAAVDDSAKADIALIQKRGQFGQAASGEMKSAASGSKSPSARK